MVSLLILIGLIGFAMADIDIPPVESHVDITADAGWESDSPPPASGEIAKVPSVGQNQVCNCTIIMIMCNCTLPGSFFFFKCEFRGGLASVFLLTLGSGIL
ncbi:MAG: hypothetical protein YFSK_3080 [Candidatus Yanofskyibacterium parasiticum]|nr:MAG: hypothetical protein YFSK_3080 [Candidatus Yanofskybacteria bacterium]